MTVARVLVGLAALLAALLARRRPRHRPVATAIALQLATSFLRSALSGIGPRHDLALLLAFPVIGAWGAAAALRALRAPGRVAVGAWLAIAAWALWAPGPAAWWTLALPAAHLAGIGAQVAAGCCWALREARPVVTVTERVVLALLAVDVAGAVAPILAGGPWWIARLAVGIGAAFLVVDQGREIWHLSSRDPSS